jgi:hypothetical protein
MNTDKNLTSPVITLHLFICLLALFWGLVYELMGICKVGSKLVEPYIQYIFHFLFSRWDLANYVPRLALTAILLISVSQVPKIQPWVTSAWFILVYSDTKMCLADSGWNSSKFTLKLFTYHLKIIFTD